MGEIDTKKRNIIIGIIIYIIFLILMNWNYFTQFINDPYKGPKSQLLYWILSIILSVIVGIIILLVNKKKKWKPEKVFVILASIFGIIYMMTTPLLKGHDERYHWYKAYAVSMGNFFQVKNEEGKIGDNLPTKVEGIYEVQDNYTIMDYKSAKKAWDYANDKEISNEIKFTNNEPTAPYPPIQMLPQAVGILIGRTIGLNVYLQGICGRFTNLLFFIIMGYFAIKHLPTKKYFLVVLLLCPKILYISATLSGDVFTNMVTILFTSYIFKLRREKQLLKPKDIVLLCLLTPCIAVSKLVYFAICGLVLLIPKECFKTKKHKVIFIVAIAILTIVSIGAWVGIADLTNRSSTAEQQKEWVLTHPISYVGVLIRGVCNNFSKWAIDMVGGAMEWHIVLKEPEIVSMIVYLVLILALMKEKSEEQEKYKVSEYIVIIAISLIVIAGIITALYLEWTAATVGIGCTEVTGVQGRYFTPIALLMTALVPIKQIEGKNKLEAKWIYIIMILCQVPSLLNMFIYYI